MQDFTPTQQAVFDYYKRQLVLCTLSLNYLSAFLVAVQDMDERTYAKMRFVLPKMEMEEVLGSLLAEERVV